MLVELLLLLLVPAGVLLLPGDVLSLRRLLLGSDDLLCRLHPDPGCPGCTCTRARAGTRARARARPVPGCPAGQVHPANPAGGSSVPRQGEAIGCDPNGPPASGEVGVRWSGQRIQDGKTSFRILNALVRCRTDGGCDLAFSRVFVFVSALLNPRSEP